MSFRTTIILVILLLPSVNSLNAQDLKSELSEVYNMNPELYNGRVFSGVYRGNVDGTQFFVSERFFIGDLLLRNQLFKAQQLNYDVYGQKVLLSFKDDINATKIIELPLANVNYFYLGTKYFEVLPWQNEGYRIFQVIENKDYKILIHYTRSLNGGTGSENNRSKFSNLKKRTWLYKEDNYFVIKNNKALIKLYPLDSQSDLKRWLKSSGMKIQKADDAGLQTIVDYLSTL